MEMLLRFIKDIQVLINIELCSFITIIIKSRLHLSILL